MKKLLLIVFLSLVSLQGIRAQTLVVQGVDLGDLQTPLDIPTSVKAWKGESLLLPFKVELAPSVPLSVAADFGGAQASLELFALYPVLADRSAGYCGEAKSSGTFETFYALDRAELLPENTLVPDSTGQHVLLRVHVDPKAKAGTYPLTLRFEQAGRLVTVSSRLAILDRTLKAAETFYTDFWQYPTSVADYYGITPWSAEHWQHLETMWMQLDDINQGSITAYAFWDLYNSRIRPREEMMIPVTRKADGSYSYDFDRFGKYVDFALKNSPDRQISFHNLFPWNNYFFFWDEASGQMGSVQSAPGTAEYQAFWEPFLEAISKYLKSRGWEDRFVIYIDERGQAETLALIQWVSALHPEFKFGYAGHFYPELSALVYDYSMPVNVVLDQRDLGMRKRNGYKTSFYTACFEQSNQPNFLLSSNYLDIYFLTLLAKSKGYDGMLRWAYNRWSSQIMTSAIYSDVPAGDAHLVYPDGQLSMRYLVLRDAIEEIAKEESMLRSKATKKMMDHLLPLSLLKVESDRWARVRSMKSYLND